MRIPAVAAALAAAIAVAGALTGCGGGSRPGASSARGSAARGGHQTSYRWLIATRGAPPSVAQENLAPGTTGWRLPGPHDDVGGVRRGSIEGYVSRDAVATGQTERIYVNAPGSRRVRIAIFRMGWYHGHGGREVLRSASLRLSAQPPCAHAHETGLTVCHWHPTLSFRIPTALPSGVYVARLSTAGGASDAMFVVLAQRRAPLLAQLPTSTYEAYNAWGGDSLYPGGSDTVGLTGTSQGVEVSYHRPYDSVTGAGQFFARDVAMVRFLERYGYPVSYTTSDSVAGDPGQLSGHRALLDFGHSEYWSEAQVAGFARARDAGTSLLFLSSDTMAWRVRYQRSSPASPELDTVVGYKEHVALDPDRGNPSGPFAGGGASLSGSAYRGCITSRLPVSGPPTYRYYSWSANPSAAPPWLFAGAELSPARPLPGIVGYELDRTTSLTPSGTAVVGSGTAPCMGSGPAEPGEPVPGPGDDLAQTTLYSARSGAIVFAAGTLGWELGLEPVPNASPDVPRAPEAPLVRITRNLLDRVLSAQRPGR